MATNAVYSKTGTQIDLGTNTNDYDFEMKNLANGAGRISAQVDLGVTPHAPRYKIGVSNKAAAALALGAQMRWYVAESDGTLQASGLGTSDAAVAAEGSFNNCRYLGATVADSTTNGALQIRWFPEIELPLRYVTIGCWNALGQALTNTDADHIVVILPVYDDIQPAS